MNKLQNLKLTQTQLNALQAPLASEAVAQHPTKPYLSTIKAIYVVERFNEVFGLGGWYINNEVIEKDGDNIVVKSTFHAPDFGITVPDIFGGNNNPDRGDAFKGACTDALTKIGSYLYVGMDVYKGLADKPLGKASKFGAHADTMSAGKITPKQKDFIMELCISKGVKTSTEELNAMNSWQASQKINSLKKLPDKVKSKAEANAELDFVGDLPDDNIPVIEDAM